MPRAGLTPQRLVAEAADLSDARGLDALTLAALAERVGVRVPSLYKHVGGLDDVRRRLALRAHAELAGVLRQASVGRAGPDALRACATAYRRWAHEHPGLHAAAQRAPDPTDAELTASSAEVTGLLFAVLRGYPLEGDAMVHAARAFRSSLHGFVTLERAGGFGLPQDVDASFAALIDLLDTGLRAGGR